ncbi:MAG: lysophospholipid acyltransferase family protein [Myxococcota bacterium]
MPALAERWLRRAVTIPSYVVAALAWLALLPVWAPAAWLVDRALPGRATLPLASFALLYLWCECAGMAASLAIWCLPPWGTGESRRRSQMRRNSALQVWWATRLFRGAERLFAFHVEVEGDEALAGAPPLLLIRHGGTADTLVAAALVSGPHGHRFRYVLKRELLVDPCLDLNGNRLPNHFVRRGSGDGAAEIRAIVALLDDLDPDEGVLIYPEGTRFSEAKRERAIARYEERGDRELAARARALRHTLLPRPGGAVALLAANPGLDVVVAAHTGFEDAGSALATWRGGLRGARVALGFWRIPFAALPCGDAHDDAARLAWLHAQWQRVDDWIAAQRARGARA